MMIESNVLSFNILRSSDQWWFEQRSFVEVFDEMNLSNLLLLKYV